VWVVIRQTNAIDLLGMGMTRDEAILAAFADRDK